MTTSRRKADLEAATWLNMVEAQQRVQLQKQKLNFATAGDVMVSFSLSVKYGIIICHLTRGSDSVLFCSVSRPTDPCDLRAQGNPLGAEGTP